MCSNIRIIQKQDLQVPGGTIESDELIIDALYREIKEETGITREELVLKGKVNKTNFYPENKNTFMNGLFFILPIQALNVLNGNICVEGGGQDDG